MKKKLYSTLVLSIIFTLCLTGVILAATQTICPIMGWKINKNIYADHDGKRVYFCCNYCIGEFNKNPEKYIKDLEDKGVKIGKTPEISKEKDSDMKHHKDTDKAKQHEGDLH